MDCRQNQDPETSDDGPCSTSGLSTRTSIRDQSPGPATSSRAVEKQRSKSQRILANEFSAALNQHIQALEVHMARGDPVLKAAARSRRLQLRDVLKIVGDGRTSLEERLRYLQDKFCAQAGDLVQRDKEVASLQDDVQFAREERNAARQTATNVSSRADDLRWQLHTAQAAKDKAESLLDEERKGIQQSVKNTQQAIDKAIEDSGKVYKLNVELRTELAERVEQLMQVQRQLAEVMKENLAVKEVLQAQQAIMEAEGMARDKCNALVEQAIQENRELHGRWQAAQAEAVAARAGADAAKADAEAAIQAKERVLQQVEQYTELMDTMRSTYAGMDQVSKQTTAQLKEQLVLIQRQSTEKQALEQEVVRARAQVQQLQVQKKQLERLCRALQAELKSVSHAATGAGAEACGTSGAIAAAGSGTIVEASAASHAGQGSTGGYSACCVHTATAKGGQDAAGAAGSSATPTEIGAACAAAAGAGAAGGAAGGAEDVAENSSRGGAPPANLGATSVGSSSGSAGDDAESEPAPAPAAGGVPAPAPAVGGTAAAASGGACHGAVACGATAEVELVAETASVGDTDAAVMDGGDAAAARATNAAPVCGAGAASAVNPGAAVAADADSTPPEPGS